MNTMKTSLPSLAIISFFIIFASVILCSEAEAEVHNPKKYKQLELPGVVGPESIAFDCNGEGPYVGVSDGRILKWQGSHLGWTEFGFTAPNRPRQVCDGSTNTNTEPICGRPLGLKFNSVTCDLYIADAYFGLMVVGPKGGQAQQLASSAEGIPFRFTNDLDIDSKTGVVYFTDSSIFYQRRDFLSAIITGDRTGRLLKYDPTSKTVTVMYRGLAFPNGVALSKDNSFLLVCESTKMQILKFVLHPSTRMLYIPQVVLLVPRFPDNIRRNSEGEFWVAMNSARGKIQTLGPWYDQDPVGIKMNGQGNISKVLYGNDGEALESVSQIEEHGRSLYTGSPVKPYVGVVSI